jgi:hypothetical protein
VPVWKSDKIGEDFIIKLPNYLAPFISEGTALNEDMGAAFAKWARGDVVPPVPVDGHDFVTESDNLASIDRTLAAAAENGSASLRAAWSEVLPSNKVSLKSALDRRHKPRALEVDAASNE